MLPSIPEKGSHHQTVGSNTYADSAPDTDYKGNFGAVLTFIFDRTMVGLRVTGESTQALVGFRF